MKKTTGICLFILCILVICGISFGCGYKIGTVQGEKMQREIITSETDVEKDESIKPSYQYILMDLNGYVTVYLSDEKTIYSSTGIAIEELSEEIQTEVKNGKKIMSDKELYNFLESHSS